MTDALTLADQADAARQTTAMQAVAQSRAAQEVQAMMIIAKRFPRNETSAFAKIVKSCQRIKLAEQSMYVYKRGATLINEPSIRLAEVLAQNWGNVDFGIIEVEQRHGESTMLSYAWDVETNTRQTKIFTVKHLRVTKDATYPLTDPRDIYEHTANLGARRLRACILGIIPGDIKDAAVAECEKTLKGGSKEPLSDRLRKMAAVFLEHGVTTEMIEARIGHTLGSTTEIELVNLRKVYVSIKDNMAAVGDFFPQPVTTGQEVDPTQSKSQQVAEQMKQAASVNRTPEPPPATQHVAELPAAKPDPAPQLPAVRAPQFQLAPTSEVAPPAEQVPPMTSAPAQPTEQPVAESFAKAPQPEHDFQLPPAPEPVQPPEPTAPSPPAAEEVPDMSPEESDVFWRLSSMIGESKNVPELLMARQQVLANSKLLQPHRVVELNKQIDQRIKGGKG